MTTPPATPSATPPASAEELRAIAEGYRRFIADVAGERHTEHIHRAAVVAQLCEEKARELEGADDLSAQLQRHHVLAADARAMLDNSGYGPNYSQLQKIDRILYEIAGLPLSTLPAAPAQQAP